MLCRIFIAKQQLAADGDQFRSVVTVLSRLSSQATDELRIRPQCFFNTRSMDGGIQAWQQAGGNLVKVS